MPFNAQDVHVGMIAYFTVNDLRRHRRIRTSEATRDNKPRPFVCYARADDDFGGDVYWTHLTCTPHPQRRTIDRKWLHFPTGQFAQSGELIIGDGRNGYVGPPDAFAELSHKHDRFKGIYRPWLADGGVEQVLLAVGGRGGPLPPAHRPRSAATAMAQQTHEASPAALTQQATLAA